MKARYKSDIPALFLALKDKDTPVIAKIFAAITVAYALSPIDLIPDFIPVLGYLDDVILLPLLITITVKLIPTISKFKEDSKMENIRQATLQDVSRISEIIITNYRVNFYPFFHNDGFYFGELNVLDMAAELSSDMNKLKSYHVYDDGVIKGVASIAGTLLDKLYVEPQFQNLGIGKKLLDFAVHVKGVKELWALEYNTRGISFYQNNGFVLTGEKMIEDEWVPLLKMQHL